MERKIDWQPSRSGRDLVWAEHRDGYDSLNISRSSLEYSSGEYIVASLVVDEVHVTAGARGDDIEASIAAVRAKLADICAPRVVGRFNDLLARISTWEAA